MFIEQFYEPDTILRALYIRKECTCFEDINISSPSNKSQIIKININF